MVPSGHEHNLAVARDDHLIELGVGRVHTLERVSIRLVELIEIDLFEIGFEQAPGSVQPMNIVLVRRVGTPIAWRGIDLHGDEAMAIEPGRENRVDLACGVSSTANLDGNPLGCHQTWRMFALRPAPTAGK